RLQGDWSSDVCSSDLGPPLVGENFTKWNGSTLADVFETLRTTMPQDSPGRLATRQYAEILAYLLQANDCPSGSDDLPNDLEALRDRKSVVEAKRHDLA